MSRTVSSTNAGAARVATLVGSQRHRTEACERLRPCLGHGQAFGDELLCLAFDMEGELVVELALDAARREQGPRAQLPVAEVASASTPAS